MLENLKQYRVMLASNSPRRRELMSQLRVPFTVINQGGIDESYPDTLPADEVALHIANKKADAYLAMLRTNELIITADTIVALDNKIYGKPKDIDDAVRMLLELSGKTHKVISGVCVMTKSRRICFTSITDVTFGEITPEEARYYVDTYMPLDKAGAYGIQEWIGCVAVEKINGSYYNVMGLPVHQLYQELEQF